MRSFLRGSITILALAPACGGSETSNGYGSGVAVATAPDAATAACTRVTPVPPAVPATLQVPAGARLVAAFHGQGTQIYTCTAAATGAYAWTLKAPDAELLDGACAVAGKHYAGPTWESTEDGSKVAGTKVADAPAPVTGAIPWLLLKAASRSGLGVFSDVTYVQRLDTSGGVAPSTGCDASSDSRDVAVGYSADYYFYAGGAG